MSNIIRKTVPLSELNKYSTVEIDGKIETVNMNFLNARDGVYDGERYPQGITKIIFKVPIKNGFRFEG